MLILASGRLSSGDAGTQLQAATVLARTGHLGVPTPPPNESGLWVQAPNGAYYQCHDPGNLALMTIPAWITRPLDHRSDLEAFEAPPLASKAIVSFIYALLGAWSAWMVQEIASARSNRRRGLLTGLVSLFCTLAIAYSKSAWDVMGCYAFAWWYAKTSLDLARAATWKTRAILELATAACFALWFRYSLAPFLLISVAGQVLSQREKWKWRQMGAAFLLATVLMAPVLAYNALRMGSPLIPATRNIKFQESNGLSGNILSGGGALLFSPNHGLFFHAPIFLLLIPALMGLKRVSSGREKTAIGWMLATAFTYFALIAKLNNSTAFGWGPRYLLPILPFLFAPIALFLARTRRWSLATWILVGVSATVNLPAILVNWHATAISSEDFFLRWAWPRHQMATWQSIWNGLMQFRSPIPYNLEEFPNFWWWSLGARSHGAFLLAAFLLLSLGAGLALGFRSWMNATNGPGRT